MKINYLFFLSLFFLGCLGANKQINGKIKNDKDFLIVENNKVILVYPTQQEVDSLVAKWDQNGYDLVEKSQINTMNEIITLLKKEKKDFTTTSQQQVYFKKSQTLFNKKEMMKIWGVIDYQKSIYKLYNVEHYLQVLKKQKASCQAIQDKKIPRTPILEKNDICSITNISKKFNFKISPLNKEKNTNDFKIEVYYRDSNTLAQKIEFTPEYWMGNTNTVPCNNFFYNNEDVFNEGLEDFHSFIIYDFNFDSLEDFAIVNYMGASTGPQYSYFIQTENGIFENNQFLTKEMRVFPTQANRDKKTLTTHVPVGCCSENLSVYALEEKHNWKLVHSTTKELK